MALILCVSLAMPLVLADEADSQPVCSTGLRWMDGIGLVCPRPDGLFEVFSADLGSLGFVHGTDPAPDASAATDGAAEPTPVRLGSTIPGCVSGAAGTYFIQVIYAQAADGADNYTAKVDMIRDLVGQANGLVDDAGVATGSPAALNVKCVGGVVEARKEILPTSSAGDSFSSIVTDLRARGYTDAKVKYWVFYDRTDACGCGGTGHIYGDSSPAASNANNGNSASMFAVTFGYNSTRIWLHELAHNMGGVQNDAPRSTLGFHCYDGRDTLCYNDGAANGSLYTTSVCATEIFDCGKNDYFHVSPTPGSYLATHWNLGSTVNRFIRFGAPTLVTLSCPSTVEEDATFACTFLANDDSGGVRYTVSWGDGTMSSVPSPTEFVAPGTAQTASSSYSTPGARVVGVSVEDDGGASGNALTSGVTAFADDPVMALLSCPPSAQKDASMSCSFRATDASPGVAYTIGWGDGATTRVPASGDVAPGVTQAASHSYASVGMRMVSIGVVDSVGHAGTTLTTNVSVILDVTPPVLTVDDPRAGRVYVGCGTSSSIPGLGFTRPVWLQAACVRATATDDPSGVDRVDVYVDGMLRASDSTAPYTLQFPVPHTRVGASLVVVAVDKAGNVASVTGTVDMFVS